MCGANGAKICSRLSRVNRHVSDACMPCDSLNLYKPLTISIIAATAVLNFSSSMSRVTFLMVECVRRRRVAASPPPTEAVEGSRVADAPAERSRVISCGDSSEECTLEEDGAAKNSCTTFHTRLRNRYVPGTPRGSHGASISYGAINIS